MFTRRRGTVNPIFILGISTDPSERTTPEDDIETGIDSKRKREWGKFCVTQGTIKSWIHSQEGEVPETRTTKETDLSSRESLCTK